MPLIRRSYEGHTGSIPWIEHLSQVVLGLSSWYTDLPDEDKARIRSVNTSKDVDVDVAVRLPLRVYGTPYGNRHLDGWGVILEAPNLIETEIDLKQ